MVVLAACSQQSSAPTGSVNDGLVLGIGEIPMGVGGIDTQVLDEVFNSVDPDDGAGIDFSVDSPSDIVFDDTNDVNYIRTRVRVTNNTGGDITNLTLMAIVPRASTLTSLSNLRNLVGSPLSQLEAFNDDDEEDPQTINAAFIPSPTNAVDINDQGEVEIIETRADFVAYDEAAGELDPIIAILNTIAANDPDFGLTGVNGTDFSLLPFGFQVGSINDGDDGFVDVTFSIPNDPDGIGVSPLARFGYTFIAVQDTEGRVTQAVEEIDVEDGSTLDGNVALSESRLTDPVTAESNLSNVSTLVLLGSAERDVSVPQANIQCIDDVRIAFNVAASIFDTTQNANATPGACILNDASNFVLTIEDGPAAPPTAAGYPAGEALPAITLELNNGTTAVEGRPIMVTITNDGDDDDFDAGTVMGITDASGQVVFSDLVINEVGDDYTLTFTAGALTQTIDIDVAPGTLDSFRLVFVNDAGEVFEPDEVEFPDSIQSVDIISVDTDTDTMALDAGYPALQAVDQFGNEVDVSGETYAISVALLQNGTALANQEILVGDDDSGIDPNLATDPYPEGADAVEVAFDAGLSSGGLFPFSADIVAGPIPANVINGATEPEVNDGTETGTLFNVSQSGTGYAIQISIGDDVIDLANDPDVVTTAMFSITATVAEIVVVQPIGAGNSTGEPLVSNSGEPVKVIVRDTNRNPIVGREVRAQIISGNTGRARPFNGNNFAALYDLNGLVPANGTPECLFNFATPTEKGAGLANVTAKTNDCMGGGGVGVPDRYINRPFNAEDDVGVEDGQRIVTAQTNALGEAIFSGDSALIIGTSGVDYQIQFSADDGLTPFDDFAANHGAAPFAVTAAPRNTFFNSITSNAFDVEARQTSEVRLLNLNDGANLGNAAPDVELTGGTFEVTAAAPNIVRYNDGAERDFGVGLYDIYGNRVNREPNQIVVTKLGAGGNTLYGQQPDAVAGDIFLTDAARTFETRGGGNDGNSIQFVDGLPLGSAGTNDPEEGRLVLADSNAVQYPAANPAAAPETSVRLRFTDLASGASYTTPSFDIP
jgi:hypothetical protein